MTIDSPDRFTPRSEHLIPGDRGFMVVIGDDRLVLEATGALLRNWGYGVLTAESNAAAVASLRGYARRPDLLICHHSLANTTVATEAIGRLRNNSQGPIPALIISADTSPNHLRMLHLSGHHLLHKPVDPATLRAVLERLVKVYYRDSSRRDST